MNSSGSLEVFNPNALVCPNNDSHDEDLKPLACAVFFISLRKRNPLLNAS